jgi:hypothetical protein
LKVNTNNAPMSWHASPAAISTMQEIALIERNSQRVTRKI